jgi:hypothetical protein
VVSLTVGANVRLMDHSNFTRYTKGQPHTYHGGLVTQSPIRLNIPRSGMWYVTVDLDGLQASSVDVSVQVLRPAITPQNPAPTRPDGFYSQHRKDGTDEMFVGPDGNATAERPHVHIIHSPREDLITLVATLADGTHVGRRTLPYSASAQQVQAYTNILRRLLR